MISKYPGLYHGFLLIAFIHLLSYYMLIGESLIDSPGDKENIFDVQLFNYFLCVSVLVVLIWISYYLPRKKLTSDLLTSLHLLAVLLIVTIIPWYMTTWSGLMPRRYIAIDDGDVVPSSEFGSMTNVFLIVLILLALSEVLFILPIKRPVKK